MQNASTDKPLAPTAPQQPDVATLKFRKGGIGDKLNSLLPDYPSFDVIAHELTNDGEGWSVNDSWHLARGCDREEAITRLSYRWEVFKLNYAKRATVRRLNDSSYDDESPCYLESDCTPFAEVRNAEAR